MGGLMLGIGLGLPFSKGIVLPTQCPSNGSIFENPDFDCGKDSWLAVNATFTVTNGVAHVVRQGQDASIYQEFNAIVGLPYEVTFKINGTSNSGFLAIRGDLHVPPYPLDYLAPGEYSYEYIPLEANVIKIGIGVNGSPGDWVDYEYMYVKPKPPRRTFDSTFDITFK